jgi:hypothetical protein
MILWISSFTLAAPEPKMARYQLADDLPFLPACASGSANNEFPFAPFRFTPRLAPLLPRPSFT